jgi:putative ABC transport system permease protein
MVVARRRHEIAVRMALGASPRAIACAVVRDGLQAAVLGIVAGVLMSGIASMTLRPVFLRFVPPVDPIVIAGVSLLVLFVALLASYAPAVQAARSSPVEALKET